ncbi:MAG: response regulator [Candidatus Paceibacterota bacterium]
MAKKVLIIEDDSFFSDVLKNKMEAEGCEVDSALDGSEGFEKIKEVKPDLILLDILLPGMNGYEILEKKMKDEDIKDIPVIVISNSGQPVEIERVLELGAKDYLIKAQFGPDEVMEKVISCVGDPQGDKVEEGGVSIEGSHVLIVEDDEFLSELLKEKFSLAKAEVTHVNNGDELMHELETAKPDVILLDIVLPRMDGYEILETIKGNEETKEIPVIMLSNLGQKSDIEKGKEKGADKFLIKALFSLDQVVNEVKKTLKEKV